MSPTPPQAPPCFIGDRVTLPSALGPVACTVTAVLQDSTGAYTRVCGVGVSGGGHYAAAPHEVIQGWTPEAHR